jgi:hypothetical protein
VVNATMSTTTTRLFVYRLFAYTVVCIMLASAFVTAMIVWYSRLHPSILHEGNMGLISYATISHRSQLGDLIDSAARWPRQHSEQRSVRMNGCPDQSGGSTAIQHKRNGDGADPTSPETGCSGTEAWNREIVKTLEDHNIFQDDQWRGNWMMSHWGREDECLKCLSPSEGSGPRRSRWWPLSHVIPRLWTRANWQQYAQRTKQRN